MTTSTYRRYTDLASLLHILRNRQLTLLDPQTWSDKNDVFYMEEYKRIKELKTLLALCVAAREETYHHWKIFSRGSDGVCIVFQGAKLLQAFDEAGVWHAPVRYETLKDVQKMSDVDPERLPFMKRWPYGDEREYRAIFADKDEVRGAFSVPIEIETIRRITLSPWLNTALVDAVRDTIRSLPGCNRLEISRSTLIENPQWKKLTGRVALPVVPPI